MYYDDNEDVRRFEWSRRKIADLRHRYRRWRRKRTQMWGYVLPEYRVRYNAVHISKADAILREDYIPMVRLVLDYERGSIYGFDT